LRVAAALDLGAVAVKGRKASALKISPKKAITTGAVTMSLADNAVSRLAIRATLLKQECRE
jgi:nitrogen fixation protein FixH